MKPSRPPDGAPEALLRQGAEALGVPLDEGAVKRLLAYLDRLLHWNRRTNLVGPCDAAQAIDRHLHDALALLRLLDAPEVRARVPGWLDVGTGAGLPGLVLAAARPGLRCELCEPLSKRLAFLHEQVAALAPTSVRVHACRSEGLEASLCRGLGAMSRATFAPADWFAIASRLVGPAGLVLVTLGARPAPALCAEAWRRDDFVLPLSGARRTNLLLLPRPELVAARVRK